VPLSLGVVFETHATSEDNERGVATGWNGGRLSETGRRQAAELGGRRRDDGVDAVFSSDLRRAVETAEIAFGGSGIPVFLDWRLRECDYGELNGMPRARLEAERSRRLHDPWPGGESWAAAVARVNASLDELAASRDGGRIVVIGHIATRWALEQRVHGRTLEELAETPFRWRPGWEYVL
jgi:2,3-bisphosphoglycerate-dependent phosphoglycerate mutase